MDRFNPIAAGLLLVLLLLPVGCGGGGGGNQLPEVTITSPRDGEDCLHGEIIAFAGTAADPEDGRLTGASLVWTASPGGIIGTGESCTCGYLSIGSYTISLTARDSQGASASASINIRITSSSQPPEVTIVGPADGATFFVRESIVFSGSATDPEDGPLTGDSLVWTAGILGEIGTGELLTYDELPVATHTITLTATDSEGAFASESITIEVRPPNAAPIVMILQPPDGSFFLYCSPVTFEGSGFDPDEGPLTGDSLVWTSSLDGVIGTGRSFSRGDLSKGTHRIMLTGTDSLGGTSFESVDVAIQSSFIQILSVDRSTFPTIEATVKVDTEAARDCGLVEDDFAVDEDDVPQVIDLVACLTSGWIEADIVVVFDDTGSMSDDIEAMKEAATRFANEILDAGADARFGLVSFKDTAEVDLLLTWDVAAFQAAVDALEASAGGDGPEVSLDAVMLALSSMSFRNDACTIFLLITDAPTHYRGDGTEFSSYTMPEVIDAVRALEDATVFAVSPDFRPEEALHLGNYGQAQVMQAVPEENDVRVLAEETGGIWLDIDEADFSLIVVEIVEYLSSLYSVVYTTSNNTADGTLRSVRITVTDPGEGVGWDCDRYEAP